MAKFSVVLILVISVFVLDGVMGILFDSCPHYVRRSSWSNRAPRRIRRLRGTQWYVIIHHSNGRTCYSHSSCESEVRRLQHEHMDGGSDDIAYNFLVGGDGTIFEGRGWDRQGGHTSGYNSRSIGIGFIGDFDRYEPTTSQIRSARHLIGCGVGRRDISSSYILRAHSSVRTTDCPGDNLSREIQTWSRDTVHQPWELEMNCQF